MRVWQGRKDSNLRMLESKSSALTNLATPLHGTNSQGLPTLNTFASRPTRKRMLRQILAHPALAKGKIPK